MVRPTNDTENRLGLIVDCGSLCKLMVYDERGPAVDASRSTEMLDSDSLELPRARCDIARGKRRDLKFPQTINGKPLEKFNNVLWTTDDSVICRTGICGDPDSATCRQKPKRRILVLMSG